ncbi:MAG: HpcH/HpaI aldolase/citrate lyase family protein [Pseudomonadota bacterium]
MPAPENHFKKGLIAGETLIGCWAGFADAYATEVLGTAGFDWLVLDNEHAPNDLRSTMAQLQALQGSDSHPVVRLPMGEAWAIKQVLDAGAQNLLIPMVDTAEQAEELVRATRYPPEGIRGSGAALGRASRFSAIRDYTVTANEQICLTVQIESPIALDNLEAICAVEGVDAAFIGPSDLAANMGYTGGKLGNEVQDAIKDALARIKASGTVAGILATDHETTLRYRDWGATMLAVGIDVTLFASAARELVARYRDE